MKNALRNDSNRAWRLPMLIALCLMVLGLSTTAIAEEAPAADAAVEKVAEGEGTYIKFTIDHSDSSKGLVHGSFGKFEVTKAKVNLDNMAESMVEISVDIASIDTGIKPRDKHLQSPDFFNVPVSPKATIMVKDAKADGENYKAEATFTLNQVTKTFPVVFSIVEKKDDGSIIIEGKTDVNRKDYNVGQGKSAAGAADVANVSVRLHIPASK